MLSTIATLILLTQQQVTAEQIYESTTPSVVTLNVERPHGASGIGTAFLAIRKNVAVTAWHVVKGAKDIKAKFSDGSEVQVKGVIDKNTDLDIAVIELECGDRKALPLAQGSPKVGSKAYVIGAPKGMDFSISDGIISQTPLLGQIKLFQFTCPVSAGNSGGPLLNAAGEVTGIVSWQLRDAQNLNFAVPVSILSQLDASKSPSPFLNSDMEDPSSQTVLTSIDDDVLQNLIKRAELSATSQDDGTGMRAFVMDSEGTKLTMFQYGKDETGGPTQNLSLSAGFTTERAVELEKINAFNRTHRFARAYREQDGTVYLENDLDLCQGIGSGNVVSFISDYATTLHEFESEVLAKSGKSLDHSSIANEPYLNDLLFKTVTDSQIEAVLSSEGLTASKQDDGTGKSQHGFKVGGTEVNLYQFTDDDPKGPTTSLTLSLGFDLSKPIELSKINVFNRTTRFFKAFADAEGDLFLVSDLDLHGGVTEQTLKSFLHRFVKTVEPFKQQLLASGQ